MIEFHQRFKGRLRHRVRVRKPRVDYFVPKSTIVHGKIQYKRVGYTTDPIIYKLAEDVPDVLTALQVSEILCVSLRTIQRYARLNHIGHFRVGSEIRFRKASIEQFIQANGFSPMDKLPSRAGRKRQVA